MEEPNNLPKPGQSDEQPKTKEAISGSSSRSDTDNARPRWNRRQYMSLITMAVANLASTACFSVLSPFFPQEASKKGASDAVIGFIFGSFELTIFFCCPIFGIYLTRLGSKFSFVAGMLGSGVVAVLFGFLDQCPSGWQYITLCFACRVTDAIFVALFLTASFAIIAYEFPGQVAMVFGMLETASGLGMMLGPVIGGALYQAGGFRLPFLILGSTMTAIGVATFFSLPSYPDDRAAYSGSLLSLVRVPVIALVGFCIAGSASTLGFLDPTLGPHLQKFHLTPTLVGVCFLVPSGLYALTAPLWGWIADNHKRYSQLMLAVGLLLSAGGYLLVGPSPLLPLPLKLYVILIGLGLMGIFLGLALVPTFQILLDAAFERGFADNFDTYGLVSGFFNSCFSFGAFAGPTYGGFFDEKVGFQWASTVAAAILALSGLLIASFLVVNRGLRSRSSQDSGLFNPASAEERQPLLAS